MVLTYCRAYGGQMFPVTSSPLLLQDPLHTSRSSFEKGSCTVHSYCTHVTKINTEIKADVRIMRCQENDTRLGGGMYLVWETWLLGWCSRAHLATRPKKFSFLCVFWEADLPKGLSVIGGICRKLIDAHLKGISPDMHLQKEVIGALM